MTNKFGIPTTIENEIRDKNCVYCHRAMKMHSGIKGTPADKATIEHLREDGPFYWTDGLQQQDLVICCGSYNSSRGKRSLRDWFKTSYCITRHINETSVAQPVQDFLKRQ